MPAQRQSLQASPMEHNTQRKNQTWTRHQSNNSPTMVSNQQSQHYLAPQALNGDNGAHGHGRSADTEKGFFMKPLTYAPDYRFNLYVQGLEPTTTTRQLFHLFEPFGNILACKINRDVGTGLCRGGFVLFDNQDSCNQARRELTLQGLYVTPANESACIKNLPPVENGILGAKRQEVPEIDNNENFPSLPTKPLSKKSSSVKTLSDAPPSISSSKTELAANQAPADQLGSPLAKKQYEEAISSSNTTPPNVIDEMKMPMSYNNYELSSTFGLGQAYLDFDSGFIGHHQQILSNGYNDFGRFERHTSFIDEKPFEGIDGIDRYMNMLELSAAAADAIPQSSGNSDERPPMHPSDAHISNTTLHDFVLEAHPRRDSTLHFENLPDGLKYQEMFEICASFGSLVLSSVDIRYINEDCFGQGRVTFEQYEDSKVALASLLERKFTVRHGDSEDTGPSEPIIDDLLYDQYYQQHQDDLLRLGHLKSLGISDDSLDLGRQTGYFSTSPVTTPLLPIQEDFGDRGRSWNTPTSRPPQQFDFMARELELSQGRCTECNGVSDQNDKGTPQVMTPHSISSLQSSSPTCLLPPCECTGQGPLVSREGSFEDFYPQMSSPNASISSKSETCADTYPQGSSKFLSYSDIVKVPPKPTSKSPNKEDALYQDLKRRGNTNTSLDESEYRLNLFLRNLEPTMNEYKLYEICVQFGPVMSCRTITSHGACVGLGFVMYIGKKSADRAIEGLKELGYHAEVAVESATEKLRCKVLSDLLFIQNIPPHIKENKLRDYFRPFNLLSCNILRDPKTEKSRGVGFIKVKDVRTAERLIEQFHGRVLGKDWKMPIQVSPAK